MILSVTIQNVNTVCQMGVVDNMTVITVNHLHAELEMVTVIMDSVHQVLFVEVTTFCNTIRFLLTALMGK